MRPILLLTLLLSACAAQDDDYAPPSPTIAGTWNLTLTPAHAQGDCIAQGALPDMAVHGSFTVRMTAAGPLVNEGQSEPGLTEVYTFDGSSVTIDSYYDTGMTGHADLRAVRRTVTGSGVFSLQSPTCSQDYAITGMIQ